MKTSNSEEKLLFIVCVAPNPGCFLLAAPWNVPQSSPDKRQIKLRHNCPSDIRAGFVLDWIKSGWQLCNLRTHIKRSRLQPKMSSYRNLSLNKTKPSSDIVVFSISWSIFFVCLMTPVVTQFCGFQGGPLSAHLMPPRLQFWFDPSHHQTCPHNAHVPQWACPLFVADEEIKGGWRGSPKLPPCPTAYLQITSNISHINCHASLWSLTWRSAADQ